jgi:hypothetical protein
MVSERLVCSLSTSAFHNHKPCPCNNFISPVATLTVGRRPLFSLRFFIHYPTAQFFFYQTNAGIKPTLRESIPWMTFFSVVLLKNPQGIPIFAVTRASRRMRHH